MTQASFHTHVMQVLSSLGMEPSSPALALPAPPAGLAVMLDGRIVGSVLSSLADGLVARCDVL